jgi:hypothetical protein
VCFLLIHHRTRDDAPLVLLANRDEAFDRPFDPPAWRSGGEVLAPRDRRAGGTWLGVTRRGLVAAITNRREEQAVVGTRSRGLLVDEVLAHADTAAALAWAREHLAREAYAGFHLLLADANEAYVIRHAGGSRPCAPEPHDVVRLRAGAHALTNLHDLDEVDVPPAGRPRPGEPLEATLARLEVLAADDRTPLPRGHRILKRGTVRGTVCSAVLAVDSAGRLHFRFAAGPPDRAAFQPVA